MQLRTIVMVAAVTACGGGSGPKGVGNSSTANSPPAATTQDPSVATWAAKLDDVATADAAVAELDTLGNPDAIAPLGEFWKRTRHVYALRVMIAIARL